VTRARPDKQIYDADIPRLSEGLFKPTKTSTTLRIHADVLAWLRQQRKGYQSRMYVILRREILDSIN